MNFTKQLKSYSNTYKIIGLLILVSLFSISASVVTSEIISTPKVPVKTETYIVKGYGTLSLLESFIKKKVKEGYIVKSVSYGGMDDSAGGIVVVELY